MFRRNELPPRSLPTSRKSSGGEGMEVRGKGREALLQKGALPFPRYILTTANPHRWW